MVLPIGRSQWHWFVINNMALKPEVIADYLIFEKLYLDNPIDTYRSHWNFS